MYNICRHVPQSEVLREVLRVQAVRAKSPAIRRRNADGFAAHAAIAGSGGGGYHDGPPTGKKTGDDDDEEPKRIGKYQLMLARLTPHFGELTGPCALVLGSCIISAGVMYAGSAVGSSMRTVGPSVRTVGQGLDGRGPHLTMVLKRGVRAVELVTLKSNESQLTFGLLGAAVAAGAAASHLMGKDTITTLISGLTCFSVAVVASTMRRKSERRTNDAQNKGA